MPSFSDGFPVRVRGAFLGLGGLALGLCLASCGTPAKTLTGPSHRLNQGKTSDKPIFATTRWLLAASAWKLVQSDSAAARLLNQPDNVLIVRRAIPVGWHGQAIESFTSFGAFQSAVAHNTLVPGVVGVGYDNESWSLTPSAERSNPARYESAFAALAHTRHLQYWQLGNLGASPGGRVHGASFATAVDLQVQSSERTPARYSALVRRLSYQARALRESVAIFAGLSTNPPPGIPVTATTLLQDVRATQKVVDGYWLNIPSNHSRACPRCGPQNPGVAIALLNQLTQATASDSNTATAAPAFTVRNHQRALWILAAAHFAQVVEDPPVQALLSTGTVYEPLSDRQSPSHLLPVVPTVVFHSASVFAQTLAHQALPQDTGAVLYDNERYATTPTQEQRSPLQYDNLVAREAHQRHLVSICDLVEPDRLPFTARTPRQEVPACDIIGLNTVQQAERNTPLYAQKVREAVQIIRTVRPNATVLAGLSTNPAGPPVTPGELAADIQATRTWVNGYWLNVPAPGVGCPGCHDPEPSVLEQALQIIEAHPEKN